MFLFFSLLYLEIKLPLGHSEPALHHIQYGPNIASIPQSQPLGTEYRSTSSASFSNQPTYYQGSPAPYAPSRHPPPGVNHTLFPMHGHPPQSLYRSGTYPQPYPYDSI